MSNLLVLQPADGSKPTKVIRKDGTKQSFDQRQKLWKFHWIEYNNFHSIVEEMILTDHSTFVLGEPTQWALENMDKVLQRTKRPKPEWPNPTVKPDRAGEQLVLDLDDVYWENYDPIKPEPAIKKYLKEHDIDCDVTWQITSGQKLNTKEARVRLYMVGESEYSLDVRKAWALKCGGDSAVYTSNQVIYTAKPIYEDGSDPIKQRIGFIEGKNRKLKMPLIEMNEVQTIIRESTYDGSQLLSSDLPDEVKSGKVYRRYFMPKAFSLLNKGLDEESVFLMIKALAEPIKYRRFDEENVREYIRDAAEKIGLENAESKLADELVMSMSDQTEKKKVSAEKIHDDILFPPDSTIKELALALYGSSHRPNKMISAMAARAIIAFVAGGKYRSEEGDRVNIQQVLTASTGVGKNVAVKAFTSNSHELFGEDNRELGYSLIGKIVRDTNSTVQGVMDAALEGNHHDLLFQIDEFGKFLDESKATKGNAFKAALNNMFLEIYSSADGIFVPRQLSRSGDPNRKQRMLQAPCFIVSAATTQSTLIESVAEEDVSSGKMGRMCIFDADAYAEPPSRPRPFKISEDLQNHISKLADTKVLEQNMILRDSDLIAGARVSSPILIKFAPGVSDYLFDLSIKYYEMRESNEGGELWARAVENIKKYACIEAVSEDYMSPVVTMDMVKRCRKLVESSCVYMVNMFAEEVSVNELDGAEKAVVARLFEEGEGKWLPQKALKELNRMKKLRNIVDKQRILEQLEGDNVIICNRVKNERGKPTVLYRLSDMYFSIETKRKLARLKGGK